MFISGYAAGWDRGNSFLYVCVFLKSWWKRTAFTAKVTIKIHARG